MGEAFGIYRLGNDEDVMPFVTHANIACGFHASDPSVMWETVKIAKKYGLKIGAHPGLADKEGFGRREIKLSRREVAALILYQTGALKSFLDTEGVPLSHIKPHGALMGMAMRDNHIAEGVADAVLALGVPIIACAFSEMTRVFDARGVEYSCEFYADLDYDDEGRQIIALTHDPVEPAVSAARVLQALKTGTAKSVNGKTVRVAADTVCVHSDTPNAIAIAKAVHTAMNEHIHARGVR
ncbi:lactam utilization protein LamB (plasmid) [Pantoea cypripedii]|uniref:Lactam utilization protein LamB n=2 Tax=Pantoea cypripedii TaxID=55209 RepID=A0A6B9G744_PANCY|nr:lactam utilization protein LamB [Pantoea cypripedii]